jgi:hypothetical protein
VIGDRKLPLAEPEVAEERFFGVSSVFNFLADPNSEAFFVIRMFFQVKKNIFKTFMESMLGFSYLAEKICENVT